MAIPPFPGGYSTLNKADDSADEGFDFDFEGEGHIISKNTFLEWTPATQLELFRNVTAPVSSRAARTTPSLPSQFQSPQAQARTHAANALASWQEDSPSNDFIQHYASQWTPEAEYLYGYPYTNAWDQWMPHAQMSAINHLNSYTDTHIQTTRQRREGKFARSAKESAWKKTPEKYDGGINKWVKKVQIIETTPATSLVHRGRRVASEPAKNQPPIAVYVDLAPLHRRE